MKLTIDITSRCNQNCEFCYNTGKNGDMDLDMFKGFVTEDITMVEIGGGEPMLHTKLPEFIRYCADNDKKVNVVTNGSLLNKRLFELDNKDSIEFIVSLHGIDDVHNSIVGANNYRTALNNVQELKQYFRTGINTSLYKKNKDQIDSLIVISQSLGVPVRFNLVYPVGKGKAVELIDDFDLKILQGRLTQERIVNPLVDSPLTRPNNCLAIERHYHIPRINRCPVDIDAKVYVNQLGKRSRCEFYGE
ncbi:radical SAM protein [Candidatus Woesearchaeota archaeon]|nr:radical SAM protein [Candidatus Woesearchaeota archaeon]